MNTMLPYKIIALCFAFSTTVYTASIEQSAPAQFIVSCSPEDARTLRSLLARLKEDPTLLPALTNNLPLLSTINTGRMAISGSTDIEIPDQWYYSLPCNMNVIPAMRSSIATTTPDIPMGTTNNNAEPILIKIKISNERAEQLQLLLDQLKEHPALLSELFENPDLLPFFKENFNTELSRSTKRALSGTTDIEMPDQWYYNQQSSTESHTQ